MRIEGNLAKWNDDRGFGFIAPTQGGSDVFVHVSAFPKDGQHPIVGEPLSFEIEIDKEGKKRAKNLMRPGGTIPSTPRRREPSNRRESTGFPHRVVSFSLFVALAVYGYEKYAQHVTAPENVGYPQGAVTVLPNEKATSSAFQCDGRTYCSQMTSCEEATFFLKNCPDAQMDGDHDGVPCEQQWCI